MWLNEDICIEINGVHVDYFCVLKRMSDFSFATTKYTVWGKVSIAADDAVTPGIPRAS